MSSWLNDFEIKERTILVKATGARLQLDWAIVHEALSWFPFFIVEKFKKKIRMFSRKSPLKIAFIPIIPRPWYMLWMSAHRADMKIVASPEDADSIFFFEDQTISTSPPLSDA